MADAARAGRGRARPDPADLPLPEDVDSASVTPTEDGGAIVSFSPETSPLPGGLAPPAFDENLALRLDEQLLSKIGNEIVQLTEEDDRSREEWKQTYAKGLGWLGLKYEDRTEPWAGACGAQHPLLLESTIRFSAQAMMDLFPPAGPVKTGIVGRVTEEKVRQAGRVKEDMNWLLLEKMKGYRGDTDMMLFNLPIAGSTFRKFRYDKRRKRPAADYILSEHVVMPYSATDILSTERFALLIDKTRNWIESQQKAGYFRNVTIGEPPPPKQTPITKKKDRIEGRKNTNLDTRKSGLYRLYESYIEYAIPGDLYNEAATPDAAPSPAPYIITVDSMSRKVLRIQRNWRETDPAKERVEHVVQHKYMPGFGPYGLGLVAILGGLTDTATSLLRQLVDAGSLSNLPAGFKLKDARVMNDSTPLSPGEWRDVDVGIEELAKSFFHLPYKEPSTVLVALLGQIVDEGRRIGSVADMKITDLTGQNMPVGTALAIIERSMKVMSAVQQRLYASFAQEYKVLAEIAHEFMGEIPYEFEIDPRDQGALRITDYDQRVDIIPVADPNASTMAQRIMALQAVIQLSQAAPQIYDLKTLHRDFINILTNSENGDRYVPPDEEIQPADPVTENMRLLTSKPVRAGINQNHQAHLAVHLAAINDPKLAGMMVNNPSAPSILAAAQAHIQEHLAFQYRLDLEKQLGVPLPPPDEPLPESVEYEMSDLIAKAADKLLERDKAEEEMKRILENMQDPVIQNESRALDIKEKQVEEKAASDAAKIADQKQGRIVDLIMTIFKEMSETERSTLTAVINGQKTIADQEMKQAERAAGFSQSVIDNATKLASSVIAADSKEKAARSKPRGGARGRT